MAATKRVNPGDGKPRLSRRGKAVALLASLGVFAAGAIASPALADVYEWGRDLIFGSTVTETQRRQLNVVNSDGTLRDGYVVEETVQGSCSPVSEILSSPNAYQCGFKTDANYVADPCLAFDAGTSVVCLTGPWDRELIRVDLDKPVSFDPTYVANEQGTPWALEVKDPRHPREMWRCLPSTGATAPIAGNRPNYWCLLADGTEYARALNDVIVNDGSVWRILFSHPNEPELVEADVAVAWY